MSKNAVTLKVYPLLDRAVEEGILYGIGRVFKYLETDTITEDELRLKADTLSDAVMSELCEIIDFGDEGDE